jgi:two-component system nitrogen regulation response regulator NtrX
MAPGSSDEPIRVDQLPGEIADAAAAPLRGNDDGEIMALPLREARELFERRYLDAQVARFGGNISRTAAFVGMERSALHRKLRSLGLVGNERTPERAAERAGKSDA